MVCSQLNSLVTAVCIPSVQKSPLKPTDWQITLWYLLWAHKNLHNSCTIRCLNCTRKWKRSRTLPTSSCRTNACMPRWNSTFQRGDRNEFSANPRESNDHHSEKYSLLGQCPQPSSTRKSRKGEDGMRGGQGKEWGRLKGNQQESIVLQDFSKFHLDQSSPTVHLGNKRSIFAHKTMPTSIHPDSVKSSN